jgi:4-hydroxy-3-methylbut-2-enyl diphosphate reductase IspH
LSNYQQVQSIKQQQLIKLQRQLKINEINLVKNIDEVPTGKVVIFSAHGVSKAVRKQANELGGIIYDAIHICNGFNQRNT